MKFIFSWIYDNLPIVIVFAIAAILSAAWLLAKAGTAPVLDKIGQSNYEVEYADILVYDGMTVNASVVNGFAKEHYSDGFTILVDATTVTSTNYASLGIGSNTKYVCVVTSDADKITKVTFTKKS